MGTLYVRDLSEKALTELKTRAARNGHSLRPTPTPCWRQRRPRPRSRTLSPVFGSECPLS
ncbi:FitA-like ribbon-helix-helix domain-containing protein [Streptomyces palmae]